MKNQKRLNLESFKLKNLKSKEATTTETNKLLGAMLSDCHDEWECDRVPVIVGGDLNSAGMR